MIRALPLRLAGLRDIGALNALVHSAYRGDSARIGWTHEADLLEGQRTDEMALADMLSDSAQAILLAEADGALVGCVQVAVRGQGLGYLGMLSVRPDLQARGLAKVLIAGAEDEARRRGAHIMEMTVIGLRTELIAYYGRRGYRDTGRRAPFPLDDPRFGSPRRRDLEFVVLAKDL